MAKRDFSNIPFPIIGDILSIDPAIGLNYLQEYYVNIAMLEAGVSYADIFKEKKDESKKISIYCNTKIVNVTDSPSKVTAPKNSIAVVNFSGAMRMDDGLSSIGISSLTENLYSLYENDNIGAIILNLNTGGGEVGASAKLGKTIEESPKKFVISSSLLASGGVLAAVNADYIFMNDDFSKIGSIGAYISIDKSILSYLKENVLTVYSDLSEDKNKGIRELLEKNTSKHLQKEINILATMFQEEVKAKRPLKGDIENTLKGEMFYSKKALDLGLIDGIKGNLETINFISSKIIFK
jgi:protease-4